MTMMILFMNIMIVAFAPSYVIGSDGGTFFDRKPDGSYQISSDFRTAFEDSNPDPEEGSSGFISGAQQVFSGLFLVISFIGLFFKIVFSSITMLFQLPNNIFLLVGTPVIIAYMITIISWIRGI